MNNLLHGDFGYSLAKRGHHVNTIIADAFPVSLDLGIRALVLSIVSGLFFGVVAALNRGKPLDYLTVVLVLVGISVPNFVLAGLLQYFFAVHWKLLPVARYETIWHTLLPSFALSLGTMAVIARYMRASMLEVVGADYIKTARAKGLLLAPGGLAPPDPQRAASHPHHPRTHRRRQWLRVRSSSRPSLPCPASAATSCRRCRISTTRW